MSRLRVGVAGPVGSGKTALVEALCLSLRHQLQLAVVTNEGGASKLRVLDSMTGELLWNPQMPSGVIHQLAWASDRDLMYGFDWALSPGKVMHLNVSTQEQLTWLDSDLTGIKVDQLSLPRRLEWRSAPLSAVDAALPNLALKAALNWISMASASDQQR